MNNPKDYDRDQVLAAISHKIDHHTLSMAPLRQQLTDGHIRTLEDFTGLLVHLGCRAGRSGLAAAGAFVLELLAIRDLTDAENVLLADVADALGCSGEDE